MAVVTLHSSRFGVLEIPEEAVIEFPSGLIGLGGTRYALLARSDDSAFVWLHSVDDPQLAVPVTNPFRFFGDYLPSLRLQWRNLRLRVGGKFLEEWRVPRRWALDGPSPFEQVRTLDPEPLDLHFARWH